MEFLVWVDVCLQFEEMEFMYKQVYQDCVKMFIFIFINGIDIDYVVISVVI